MAYHEGRPWKDPSKRTRTQTHLVLGCALALALLIALAVIEIQAAAFVVGLALLTALVLWIAGRTGRRRGP
ncbi:hypothetical protein [Streptomyces fructofermentans]|uniref:hypothetical protein n=1 Tax=Streptomyces fructofermentans TaxID=152141 RepID=UPI0037A15394